MALKGIKKTEEHSVECHRKTPTYGVWGNKVKNVLIKERNLWNKKNKEAE